MGAHRSEGPPYDLRLLGGVLLTGPSGPVSGRAAQPRRLALLALLATFPDGLSRERIAAYLWLETSPDKARHLVADSLYVLRKELGETSVRSEGDLLRLDRSVVQTDVALVEEAWREERPDRVVELYRGPFLEGLAVGGAPEFEKWTDGERRRLAALYGEALERLARGAERRGEWRQAVRWWRELASHDPYDSAVAAALAEALRARGNRAAALRHLTRHRDRLRDELDIEPSASIASLLDSLAAGQPGEIEGLQDAPGPAAARSAAAAVPVREPSAASDPERPTAPAVRAPGSSPGLFSRLGVPAVVAATVALAAVGLAIALSNTADGGSAEGAGPDPAVRILVLPFAELGGLEARYLADGLTGEIRSRLGRIPSIAVISRTTSLHYGASGKTIAQIGTELGVDYVLEGSVRWHRRDDGPTSIRVTPQLVRVRDDRNVWSRSYEIDVADILDLEGRLAGLVTSALELELVEAEQRMLAARPTGDVEAYYLYLRARHLVNEPDGDLQEARSLFEEATARDSGFAAAWAGLAGVYTGLAWRSTARVEEAQRLLSMARATAGRAIDLDPTLAEGHAVLASILMLEPDWQGAEREIRRAIDLNPSDARSRLSYALLLAALGRPEEARWQIEHAHGLDPLSRPVNQARLRGLMFVERDYEAFIREGRRIQEAELGWAGLDADLGSAYLHIGRRDSARLLVYPTVGLDPSRPLPDEASAVVDSVLSGRWIRPARRITIISELEDRSDLLWAMIDRLRRDYLASTDPARQEPHDIAIAFGHLGEVDSAFVWIEKIKWDVPRVNNLRWGRWSDTLRSDPRYATLLRRIGVGRPEVMPGRPRVEGSAARP